MKHERVYRVVRLIPRGAVLTYGQVAALSGHPGAARYVGTCLGALASESDVPWHRVLNAQGKVSVRGESVEGLQRTLLLAEGVTFDERGRVDLTTFGAALELGP